MRVAAIYDVHGNLPALEAVVAEIESTGVDVIVVGGDMIPGPFPVETIELLRGLPLPVHFISGNGERETLALLKGEESKVPPQFHEGILWNGKQLERDHVEFVGSLAPQFLLDTSDAHGEVLFCHATPRNDFEIFTKTTPESNLKGVFDCGADHVVCGHTHMQFDRVIGQVRVTNAGSVGMAFGSDKAQWLLIGDNRELRSTAYDRKAAAQRILATDYPEAESFVGKYVLSYPGEAEMVKLYESVAIRK